MMRCLCGSGTDHRVMWRWFRSLLPEGSPCCSRLHARVWWFASPLMRQPPLSNAHARSVCRPAGTGQRRISRSASVTVSRAEPPSGIACLELEAVDSIFREGPTQVDRLHALLIDPKARAGLGAAVRALRERLTILDAAAADAGTTAEDAAGDALVQRAEDFARFAAAGARLAEVLRDLGPFVRRPEDLGGVLAVLKAAAQFCGIEEEAASKIDAVSSCAGGSGDGKRRRWHRCCAKLGAEAPSDLSAPAAGLAAHACAQQRDPLTEAALIRVDLDRFTSDTEVVADGSRLPARHGEDGEKQSTTQSNRGVTTYSPMRMRPAIGWNIVGRARLLTTPWEAPLLVLSAVSPMTRRSFLTSCCGTSTSPGLNTPIER